MRNELKSTVPRIRREDLVVKMCSIMNDIDIKDTSQYDEHKSEFFIPYIKHNLLSKRNVDELVTSSPIFWPTALLKNTSIDFMMAESVKVREVPSLFWEKKDHDEESAFLKAEYPCCCMGCCGRFVEEMKKSLRHRRRSGFMLNVVQRILQLIGVDETGQIDAEMYYKIMYRIAVVMVAGYSFGLGEKGKFLSMVPFFDMLNHVDEADSHVVIRHKEREDVLQVILYLRRKEI